MRKNKTEKTPVILASASARRKELLAEAIDEFEVIPAGIDENRREGENAEKLVKRLAREKARKVAGRRPDAIVIGADTVVECEGQIIGKPASRQDAIRILKKITSTPHQVVCGICVIEPDGREHCTTDAAEIHMKKMTTCEIKNYVDNYNVLERAGAYGLKAFDPNVREIKGSRNTVMGLALEKLLEILEMIDKDEIRKKS